jgi:hypothetical protein
MLPQCSSTTRRWPLKNAASSRRPAFPPPDDSGSRSFEELALHQMPGHELFRPVGSHPEIHNIAGDDRYHRPAGAWPLAAGFPNEGVDAMTIDSGPKAGLQLGFAGSQTAPAGAEIDLPII